MKDDETSVKCSRVTEKGELVFVDATAMSTPKANSVAAKRLGVGAAAGGVSGGGGGGGDHRWQNFIDREHIRVERCNSGGSLTSTPMQNRMR